MTLGNMRMNGARVIEAFYLELGCHHHAVIDVDHLPYDLPVPDVALRLRCSACSAQCEDNPGLTRGTAGDPAGI